MHRRFLLLVGTCALAAPAFAAAPGPWRALFAGRDLDAFTPLGAANWRIVGGLAEADAGDGFLVTKETFGDFELRAEVWVDAPVNSGILIRCGNPAEISPTDGYEVNIYDMRPDPSYGTGALVNVAKVNPMPKAGNRWNLIRIRAVGDTFDVWLNGVQTVKAAKDSKFSRGHIALQRFGSGAVKWRKVEIRSL